MTWRAALGGQTFDLDLLVTEFTSAGARVVRDDGGDYWLESASFEKLSDADAVHIAAGSLLSVLNGAAKLTDDSHRAVKLQGRVSDGSGGIHTFVRVADTVRLRANAPTIEVSDAAGQVVQRHAPPPPKGPSYLAAAERHPPVREVLEYLADDHPGWVTLYKVKEVVQADAPGGLRDFASTGEMSMFSASANRPDLSGPDARHARTRGETPTKSMTLGEGRAFIRRVVDEWIAHKQVP